MPVAPWVTLASGGGVAPVREIPSPRRIVAQLLVAAAVVFAVVIVGTAVAANRLAEREAVNDVAHTANLLALAVVQPALRDSLLDGDAAAYDALDSVVRERVLPNGIVRVKLWTPSGQIVYADERRLLGQRFALDEDQVEALTNPQTKAEVSELDRSENEFEQFEGKLLEVYRPVWTPSGRTLLFEVYGEYEPVRAAANNLWRGLGGLIATSLLLMLVLMAPILWRVLERLRVAQVQREELLRRAVDASDEERRRIAATVHDGPVQELVASSLVVSTVAEQARAAGQQRLSDDIRAAAATVRSSVASLRSLLVDIYPDRLGDAGLLAALTDLAGPLRSRGTEVSLQVDPGAAGLLDERAQQVVYRVARECLRNVAKHASAHSVHVALTREAGGSTVLLVGDDGLGFDVPDARARPGHFGLRVLSDLARDAGAVLMVASAAGRGTRWRLELPSDAQATE